jgi:predicted FMN-binding regulatory protein PaiB
LIYPLRQTKEYWIFVKVTRIEAKYKLSQNRPGDQPGVIAALSAGADQADREVAELMKQTLPSPLLP